MQRVADVKPSSASQPVSESTFAVLLKPLIEPGFRLAVAMLHDPHAAEDAVQEASFTAWRKLGRMQDQGRLRPWFLGVVANKCRNARRKKWVLEVSVGVPEELPAISSEERTLRGADLTFYGRDAKPRVEPGTFDVWIAPSAESDGVHGTFDLTA